MSFRAQQGTLCGRVAPEAFSLRILSLLPDSEVRAIAREEERTSSPPRVPRDTFARIWEAWRDGYTDSIVQHGGVSREEVERRWREMIECARDPQGYALWQIPLWTAAKP